MSGVPDYTLEDVLDFKFSTRQFTTGAPFAFDSGAIEIYEDNSVTQITGAETLTLEFDGITGLHNLRVAATAANGFENGKSYHCVVSAGTVDSVSVVGEVVQQFSIGRSAAAADLANGTDGLGALNTLLLDIPTVSEFDARTLVAASYFDPAADPVALVTAVTNDVGITQAGADKVWGSAARTLTALGFVLGNADAAWVDANDRIDLGRWVGTTVTISSTSAKPEVDAFSVSDDAAAADNLELQFDTTGLTGDNFPATQAQVGNIGASSGGALNFEANADNSGGTIDPGSTAFVGVETNDFTDTDREDGVYHIIADATNVIDVVYGFSVGGGRTAVEVIFHGFANANNDDLTISAWDHPGAEWETIGTLNGKGGSANETITEALLLKHTGTGSEIGKVYIRFNGSGLTGSAALNVDQLLVEAVNIGQSTGYANGQIWVDTVNGAAGTEDFVNGTVEKAVLTWADALTLSASLGITDFHIINGSAIQLTADSTSFSLFGDNWTLDLNGQICAGAHFEGAHASGTCTGADVGFHGGEIRTMNIGDDVHFDEVGLAQGTITLAATGSVVFDRCHHASTDGTLPILDFGAVGNMTVHLHAYHGGIAIHNFGDSGTDIVHLDGMGRVDINANSAGGTLNVRGAWEINDSGASTTINVDDQRADTILVLEDTGELQTDWVNGGRLDSILDARMAEASISTTGGAVDTVTTNTDMRGTENAALASVATEARLAELDGANMPAGIDAILLDTGTTGVPLTAAAVDLILDEVFEGTTTLRQFLRLAASALYGKLSGAATTTVTIRDEADTKDRITATVDSSGNRTAVTLDKTA